MQNWLQIDEQHIWHPFTPLKTDIKPLLVEQAKGCWLHTSDGKKILDAVSSWWVNIHGHSNDYIAKAAYEQLTTLEHVIFAGFTHKPALELTQRLLEVFNHQFERSFFSDNGSTSVEVAIKMAIQYFHNLGDTKRKKVIAIDGAYHGDTFGSMSVGERGSFNEPFHSLLFDVYHIPFPEKGKEHEMIENIKQALDNGNDEEYAAFIYEPLVQGSAGMRMYSPETLEQLMKIAKDHNLICIADEVMTGFGRTGKNFASDYIETKPDIICLSKGITGGTMPLGLTLANKKITAAFDAEGWEKTFFHGHSYTANPLACRIANASLDLFLGEECQNNIKRITQKHIDFITENQYMKGVKDLRSTGTILAIELDAGTTSYFNKNRNNTYNHFLSKNILLRPLGNVIYILPPYIITNDELDSIYSEIKAFIKG